MYKFENYVKCQLIVCYLKFLLVFCRIVALIMHNVKFGTLPHRHADAKNFKVKVLKYVHSPTSLDLNGNDKQKNIESIEMKLLFSDTNTNELNDNKYLVEYDNSLSHWEINRLKWNKYVELQLKGQPTCRDVICPQFCCIL